MTQCDLTDEQVPNFNRNFYYNQTTEAKCLNTCFNSKMLLHFGEQTAREQDLFWNLDGSKKAFQRLELMNPNRKMFKEYEKGYE